jgi:RNA polymerase sigma-70 factor, ECF subfamily
VTVHAEEMTERVPLSFEDAFRSYHPVVSRTAGLVAHDPQLGSDIAQEAFVRLYERWDRMTSLEHARNFALRVAVNLARSHLRRRIAAPFGLHGPEVRVPDATDATDAWLLVSSALAALPASQRAAVVLVDYADLDAASAGKILGIQEGTVRVHVMRGRRALRLALSMAEPQEPADAAEEVR